MNADVGNLLFILDESTGKKRPHVCIAVFTNSAGVRYDWLVVPITSVATVGDENLVQIRHSKLKKDSFAKLNNITTIKAGKGIEIASIPFEEEYVQLVKGRLRYFLI